MTHDDLIKKIKKAVEGEADAAIRKLRKDVREALMEFCGGPVSGESYPFTEKAREVLVQLAKENPNKGWPGWVWEEREQRKLDEVLETMNALQRVLVAKEQAPENTPAEIQLVPVEAFPALPEVPF